MAQKVRSRQRQEKNKTKKQELDYYDERDEFEDDDSDIIGRHRKRSQAPFKLKVSRKKQDMLVVFVASIIIIGTLFGYYYYVFALLPSSDSNDDGLNETIISSKPLYDADLFVISDISHNWDKTSWQIMDYNGLTNFLLRVKNSGQKIDTYKLTNDLSNTRIQFKFDKNNFQLNPGQTTAVIINVTTNINYDLRVQPSINVNLISGHSESISDSIKLDITISKLDSDQIALKSDKVATYYAGGYENGTLFDFSFKNPEEKTPLFISLSGEDQMGGLNDVPYNHVIVGFQNGVIGMVPGETHVIVVPPELGYDESNGPQHLIGKTLIFHVRLLSNDRDT